MRFDIKIISTKHNAHQFIRELKIQGKSIGFVPTMGYLHEGHISLVRESKLKTDITIVSIFVNPTQFAPHEDFSRYPRDLRRDSELLRNAGADVLFYPEVSEIYPEGASTFVNCETLTDTLEGEIRPGHFKGVTTVVSILFNIIQPDYAYFGQKDAQQAAVIKKMTSELGYPVHIEICPIIREKDGLAMSSRNTYLSPAEREDALVLSSSLNKAKSMIAAGVDDPEAIYKEMLVILGSVSTSDVDYVKIVSDKNFKPADKLIKGNGYYILVACRIGKTRLIDNIHISL